MEIKLYDFEFNLLAIASEVISSEWCLKYNGIGIYEGKFPINSAFAKAVIENPYTVICEGDKQAVVTGIIADETLTVCGRTPEWLLTKRVVLPFKTSEVFGKYCAPEAIITYLLNRAYVSPPVYDEDGEEISGAADADRIVENFEIPELEQSAVMDRYFWRNSANTLSQVVCDLCEIIGCGHSLVFDVRNKCWRFSLVYPQARELIISKSNKNAYDIMYTDDFENSVNAGFYTDSETGDEFVYKFIQDDEKQNVGIYCWDGILSASGASEAEKVLKKRSRSASVEAEILNLEFGRDYSLGDTVRLQTELGPLRTTVDKRIAEVSIILNESGLSVKPSFTDV